MKENPPPLMPIPADLIELCDSLSVPVSIADPDAFDMPLIYVNKAFEDLTQWSADEVIGKNCRFLQGPKTDRTIVDELAVSFHERKSEVCCIVNYRRDGSEFLNMIVVHPVHLTKSRELLMGCQLECNLGAPRDANAQNVTEIDIAVRNLHAGRPLGNRTITSLETFILETTLMRINAVFIKIQNQVIAMAAAQMRQNLLHK